MKLYGKNPVLERIKHNPKSIKKIYLREKTDLSDIVRALKDKGLVFTSLDKKAFDDVCPNVNSQGVVAEINDFNYTGFLDLLAMCVKNGITPVFIDGVTDPQNMGSIIRSLACMGGFSIIIPEHDSVPINETVLRVASGGENYVNISMITNTVKGVTAAREKGFYAIGAVAGGGENINDCAVKFPLAVVIGAEGKGIRPGILKILDKRFSLPMEGIQLSYNVAIAAALICNEVKRKGHSREGGNLK